MEPSQNSIDVYQHLLLEWGDRILGDLRSIGLEVAVAKQHLTDVTATSSVESIRESINRASAELDRAEHDLGMVLAAIVLDTAATTEAPLVTTGSNPF